MTPRAQLPTTLMSILLITFVFAAGVLSGAAADRLWFRADSVKHASQMSMNAVLDRLGLTPAQRSAVEAILEREAPNSQRAMLELSVRLRNTADSIDTAIRSILTPQQRTRLDALRPQATFVLKRRDSNGATYVDTVSSAGKH